MIKINLKHIQKLGKLARMTDASESAALNVDRRTESAQDLITYWLMHKTTVQYKNLRDRLKALICKLNDFQSGNIDSYIDAANKYDYTFEPYECLMFELDGGSIYDLPERIEQYRELLNFSRSAGQIANGIESAFTKAFPGLTPYVLAKDQDGNDIAIPKDMAPKSVQDRIEINKDLGNIETEHCLDSYNEWRKNMVEMIKRKADFKEMLDTIVL